MRSVMFFFSLALLAAGCTATQGSYHQRKPYSRELISAEEINLSGGTNAYELVRKLRPHWLRSRGQKSIKFGDVSYPIVYVNGGEHGSLESLSQIPVEHISEIRFLSAGDATLRFGWDHPSGAILVKI